MAHPEASRGDLGTPTLSTWGAIGQALAIGPIFSAGFVTGAVAVFAGFNTPLSVLCAGLGTMSLCYALVLYGRRFAGAGAVYEYLARGVHSMLGVVGGGAYLLGLLLLGGGGFIAEGVFVSSLLRREFSINSPWGLWALGTLLCVVAINWAGVRIGVGVIAVLAAISSMPFLLIAVATIAKGGARGNSWAVFDPAQTSWTAVFHGILFGLALFIGFETAACLGEESRRPRHAIPLAMLVTVAISTAFYLLVSYAGAIGFGAAALRNNAWYGSPNPFGDLGDRYVGGHTLGAIVSLAIIIDLGSVLIAFTLAASRLLMALARDGLLPRPVMRTSRRFHTPTGGLTVILVWALLVIGLSAVTHFGSAGTSDAFEAFLILSATGSYLITVVYLFLAAGAVRLVWSQRSSGGTWWQMLVVAVAAAVPVLALEGALNPFPAYPSDIAVYLAASGLGASLLWCAALRLLRPDALRGSAGHATRYAAEQRSVPPANLAKS